MQDLFNWQVGLLNNVTWSLWGSGAFHVGLQIYGYEYAFGGPMAEVAMKQSLKLIEPDHHLP